jgi:hypothetical protein
MKKTKKLIKAKKQISLKKSDLAFVIDLLSTSKKYGQDILSAINSLKEMIPEPLAGEFQMMAQEQKLGMPSDEILINFANRLKVPAIHQMVQAELMAIISGAPSSSLLDQIAQDIRQSIVSFKQDKSLFEMKAYKGETILDSQLEKQIHRESEVLKVDEKFLNSHGSFIFLKQAMLVGKNVLIVCHDPDLLALLVEHFKEFKSIDLEKENVAEVFLGLSDNPLEKGKLLFIKAATIHNGFQRCKAHLAFQERNANANSIKMILDLFYFIPLQICITTNKSQQSWISEICELRTILEDGFLFVEPIFVTQMTGFNKNMKHLGYFGPTGYIPKLIEDIERDGDCVTRGIFIP